MKTYPHEFNVEVYEKTLTSRHYLPQCPGEKCFDRLMVRYGHGWKCPKCETVMLDNKHYGEELDRFKSSSDFEMLSPDIKMPTAEEFLTSTKFMMARYAKVFIDASEKGKKDILDRAPPLTKEIFKKMLDIIVKEASGKTIVDNFIEIVNKNLFEDKNYRPYCANNKCTSLSRAILQDGKFRCHCGWESPKTPKFLEAYISHHKGEKLPDVCYTSDLADKLVETFKPKTKNP